MLLPFVEAMPVANSLNLMLTTAPRTPGNPGNTTAGSLAISSFLCPSDPLALGVGEGLISYRANLGTCVACGGTDLWDGCFWERIGPLAAFRDGLSNTLAFAEKPIGTASATGPFSSFRDWSLFPTTAARGATADSWVSLCSGVEDGDAFSSQPRSGRSWLGSGAISTGFFTAASAGSMVPDCGTRSGGGTGNFAARSYHLGGVNAVLADGSARWFSSRIATQVWRALGTRAGGEFIAE